MKKNYYFKDISTHHLFLWMTKFLSVSLIALFSFSSKVQAKITKTCEDFGMTTTELQVLIDSGVNSYFIGEPRKFCTLSENDMSSIVAEDTILSSTPNLAASAYLTGPTPVVIISGMRADRAYCLSLGGTYQFGKKALSGGWTTQDRSKGKTGMCVFADGSMIATWTLFYKRLDPASDNRPNLEPFFQNKALPFNPW